MYTKDAFQGKQVVKLVTGPDFEVASIKKVEGVDQEKGLIYLDKHDLTDDGPNTYNIATGKATVNWLPGYSSRVVPLEE